MNLFLTILLISIIEYIGDSNFKFYARESKIHNLVIALAMYLLMCVHLVIALKKTNITYLNGIWDGVSIIIESLLAYIILRETLSNRIQYVGLFMIIIGIATMSIGQIPK